MYVSNRFRDIFTSGPINIRRGDASKRKVEVEAISDAEFDKVAGDLEVDLIWLEIAHAHQKAARAFTPPFTRAEDLASSDV